MSGLVLDSELMERLYSPVREIGNEEVVASSQPMSPEGSTPSRMSSRSDRSERRSVHNSHPESLLARSTGDESRNRTTTTADYVTDKKTASPVVATRHQRRKQMPSVAAAADHSHAAGQSSNAAANLTSSVASPPRDDAASVPSSQSFSAVPKDSDNDNEMQRSFAEFESETIAKQRQELQLLIAELRDRDRELNEMVSTHQRQIDAWDQDRRRAMALEEKCSRLQKELQCRGDEVHMLSAQLRVAEAEELNRRTAVDSTRDQLAAVTEQHSQAVQHVAELENHRRRLSRTGKQLQSQIQQFETREQELLSILASKDRDLSDSSSNVTDLSARLKKSEQLIGQLRSVEAELRRTNTDSGNKIVQMRREIEHFRKQSQKSEQQRDELQTELQGLKMELSSTKKEVLLAYERDKRKDQLLALQRSKQERTDAELTSIRELYERQQRDFSMLQLSFESTKQLLTHQQKVYTGRHPQSTRSSFDDENTSRLLAEFTEADVDERETKSHDATSSCQNNASEMLSSEMLPEKDTRSAAATASDLQDVCLPESNAMASPHGDPGSNVMTSPRGPDAQSVRSSSSRASSRRQSALRSSAESSLLNLDAVNTAGAEDREQTPVGLEDRSMSDQQRSPAASASSRSSTVVASDCESEHSGHVADMEEQTAADRPFLEMTKTFADAPTDLLRWSRVGDVFTDRRCQSAMDFYDSSLSRPGSVTQLQSVSAACSVSSTQSTHRAAARDQILTAETKVAPRNVVNGSPESERSSNKVASTNNLAADCQDPFATAVRTDSAAERDASTSHLAWSCVQDNTATELHLATSTDAAAADPNISVSDMPERLNDAQATPASQLIAGRGRTSGSETE